MSFLAVRRTVARTAPTARTSWGGALATLGILIALAGTAGAQQAGAPPRPAAIEERPVRFTDDAGKAVLLRRPARRIVSLVPSATETLIALGAATQIVGRTDYDVAPEVATLPSVGGGIDPSVEAVVALRPDAVISWGRDRRQRTRVKLEALGIPVISLSTEDTSDVFRVISDLGALSGHTSSAQTISARLRSEFRDVARSVSGLPRPLVFYVMFNDPPMTTGLGTFIGQLITLAGGRLAFAELGTLWPSVSVEAILQRNPDVIVLPVGEKVLVTANKLRATPGWRDLSAVRDGRVVTIPANLLNRPGPHLGEVARALRDAIHSDAVHRAVRARGPGR